MPTFARDPRRRRGVASLGLGSPCCARLPSTRPLFFALRLRSFALVFLFCIFFHPLPFCRRSGNSREGLAPCPAVTLGHAGEWREMRGARVSNAARGPRRGAQSERENGTRGRGGEGTKERVERGVGKELWKGRERGLMGDRNWGKQREEGHVKGMGMERKKKERKKEKRGKRGGSVCAPLPSASVQSCPPVMLATSCRYSFKRSGTSRTRRSPAETCRNLPRAGGPSTPPRSSAWRHPTTAQRR